MRYPSIRPSCEGGEELGAADQKEVLPGMCLPGDLSGDVVLDRIASPSTLSNVPETTILIGGGCE